MSNQITELWSSEIALAKLFESMSCWINSVADCETLKTALTATIKGHVDGHEFDKTVMTALTTDFAAKLEHLGAALGDTSIKLAELSWAFDDACSAILGITAQEASTKLAKLNDAVSASRSKYVQQYAPQASRPVQRSVDQLIMELAHIFQRYSGTPPIVHRSNGQLMLNQSYDSLLGRVVS